MAKIDGIDVPLIWALVSLTHQRVGQLVTEAESTHKSRINAELSVTRNLADSEALIKIISTPEEFNDKLPGNVRSAITRIYTEADHHEALALLNGPAWTRPESADEAELEALGAGEIAQVSLPPDRGERNGVR